ncbi:PKD domain-containing protein [Chitinophaga niastensis]|uniref:PKD domain-containing protein n=1 Tax=Chitinophaga niastensis TaxID=536980 RepID=UPI001304A165|nr:PKD domain-containing protein [Chitinophaga niastensis]
MLPIKSQYAGSVLLCLFVSCFIISGANAQQKADFSASSLSECESLITTFTDKSTGSPVSWLWSFGNGSTSIEQNPRATYVIPGAYTVTLKVTYADSSSVQETKAAYIHVRANPVVDFSISGTKNCVPFVTTFTDKSQPGDGTLQRFSWDFGDGNVALNGGSSTSHTYNQAGIYGIVLTVTNSYGCTSFKQKDKAVDAEPIVNADFNVAEKVFCTAPADVLFTNTSIATGNITYKWEFDDGTISHLKDPGAHTFITKGTHSIKLTVANELGCTSTKTINDITVGNYATSLTVPTPVCTNSPATYRGVFSPARPQSIAWEFNDQSYGGASDSVNYTAQTAGPLKVKLTTMYGNCKDVVEKVVNVNPSPVGLPSSDYASICNVPATVHFKDNTTGATSWKWLFGDQQSSAQQTPAHTYLAEGYYKVILLATSAAGCTTTFYGFVNFPSTQITANASNVSGCEELATVFSATSNNGQIKNYAWDFGDGSPISTDATPKHVYAKAGTYVVYLEYTTTKGCTGKVRCSSDMEIYKKPIPDFSSPDAPVVCGNNTATFIGKSDIGDRWVWNFGDKSGNSGNTQTATHSYTAPGTYDISLTVWNHTCSTTVIKKGYIKAINPFPRFRIDPINCGNRTTISVNEFSLGANSWKWSWGDGKDTSYTIHSNTVTHTYPAAGNYTIQLTTADGTCTTHLSANTKIITASPVTITTDKTTLCSNEILTADITKADYAIYSSAPFHWQLNDSTKFVSGNSDRSHKYTDIPPGKKSIRMLALNQLGCYDTSNVINISVRGPLANYKLPGTIPCRGTEVTFTDATDVTNSSGIKKWEWNFGDSTPVETFTTGPFRHIYTKAATNINPVVTVTDKDGCVNTYSGKKLQVNGPNAGFYADSYLVKPGSNVSFTNTSSETGGKIVSIRWNFGDGNTSTAPQNVIHNYPNKGVYAVKLQIMDNHGCKDEAGKSIKVSPVLAGFNYTSSFVNGGNCAPMLFRFSNISFNAVSYFWDFGDGNTSDQINPIHTYITPGRYTVILKVKGKDGIEDEVQETVIVKGPLAEIQTNATGGCLEKEIEFTIQPHGATTFNWDFTDGFVEQTNALQIKHTFRTPGIYKPRLLLKDDAGCKGSAYLDHPIVIDQLDIKMNFSPGLFCDTGTLFFAPKLNSFSIDTLGIPGTYKWTYDPSLHPKGINTATPEFYLNKTGTYAFSLLATTVYGCVQTAKATVNVYPTPLAAITGPDKACLGVPVTLGGGVTKATDVTWNWNFGNGAVSTQQQPAPQTFSTPANYNIALTVTSKEGCSDKVFHPISVLPLPDIKASAAADFICLKNTIILHASGGNTYEWTPATGLDNPSSANPKASPVVTTTYKVKGTDNNGCVNNDQVEIRVVQPFTIQAGPDTALCLGDKLSLHVSGADKYTWEGTGIDNPSSAAPNIVITSAGSYVYNVTGYDKEGCFSDHTSVNVKVSPMPFVNAGPDQEVMAGTPVYLVSNNSSDVVRWRWSPPDYLDCATCQRTRAIPNLTTSYHLEVENIYGCKASDDIIVHIVCNQGAVFMPNAFTPNHDGLNETIYPKGKGVKEIEWMRIYDRWGKLIFENTHFPVNAPSAGWDGRSKNQEAPIGTYIYFMQTVCESGEKFQYKGSIILIR